MDLDSESVNFKRIMGPRHTATSWRFARSVERKMAVRKRDTKYHDRKMEVNEYLEYIKNENVKLDLD